jgi:histidinol-phosphatase
VAGSAWRACARAAAWGRPPWSKCSRPDAAQHYIPAIPPSLSDDLALALSIADAADRITVARFRAHDLHVETKPDLTPVSEADRAVEAAVRERLEEARPDDGVLGEEMGEHGAGRARRWIIDPIDGTMSYVRGVPVWATLLALEVDGEMAVGVVSAPALGRRWWAARGHGAFADGDPIRVSEVHRMEDAHVCAPNERYFEQRQLDAGWREITQGAWRPVGFADFWGHMLVAEGAVDVMVEPILSLWDVAALRPIVEEAGGRISDLTGDGWAEDAPCVTTNGLLHDEVIASLTGGSR